MKRSLLLPVKTLNIKFRIFASKSIPKSSIKVFVASNLVNEAVNLNKDKPKFL